MEQVLIHIGKRLKEIITDIVSTKNTQDIISQLKTLETENSEYIKIIDANSKVKILSEADEHKLESKLFINENKIVLLKKSLYSYPGTLLNELDNWKKFKEKLEQKDSEAIKEFKLLAQTFCEQGDDANRLSIFEGMKIAYTHVEEMAKIEKKEQVLASSLKKNHQKGIEIEYLIMESWVQVMLGIVYSSLVANKPQFPKATSSVNPLGLSQKSCDQILNILNTLNSRISDENKSYPDLEILKLLNEISFLKIRLLMNNAQLTNPNNKIIDKPSYNPIFPTTKMLLHLLMNVFSKNEFPYTWVVENWNQIINPKDKIERSQREECYNTFLKNLIPIKLAKSYYGNETLKAIRAYILRNNKSTL